MEVGRHQTLEAARNTPQGVYLTDEQGQEVLLPRGEVPEDLTAGQSLEVFIYTDSEDRLTATMKDPKVRRDEFAYLQVNAVNQFGAFLDWGLDKDLLVPFSGQRKKMEPGKWYLVYVYLDELTNRLVASAKINRFFDQDTSKLQTGDQVEVLVGRATDLGYQVVVNNRYNGLIYNNDIFQRIKPGHRLPAYIAQVREDGKLDISLRPPGHSKVEPNAEKILDRLREKEGFLDLSDSSSPEQIKSRLAMSKKTFKKALGSLYRQRLIRIEPEGIYLTESGKTTENK